MASLKVCLLAPDFLPVWGGAGTYAVELARELSRKVDLTVLTLARKIGQDQFSKQRMEETLDHRVRVEVISEAHDNFRYNAAFQVAVLRRLPRLARTEGFDIIHSQHAHMPDLLYRRCNRSPPMVRTVHSTISGQRAGIRMAQQFGGGLDPSESWQIGLEPVLRLAEWVTLHDPGPLLTVSHFMEKDLLSLGLPAARIRVVYNGVPVDRFRPDAPGRRPLAPGARGPVILYSGRPTLIKGIGVMVDAIPLILREVPEAHFAFAGGTKAEFASLIEGKSVPGDRVHVLGRISHADLPAVYASADIAVAPTFADNVPFWILEAMSSGLPVVASNVGGIAEVVEDGKTGILIAPGSPEVLARELIGLLKDPARRAALGGAARTSVSERFTWVQTAAATIDLYRSSLDGPGVNRHKVDRRSPRPVDSASTPSVGSGVSGMVKAR
jgi:glycosyltransferase involved in cell wall biosynthesis